MIFSHLRAFHAVADKGSFTRAADFLNVTQPTLSGQVKALEETYGVKLFERRGRGVKLTDLGTALLEITRRQFALHDEAERLLIASRGLLDGRLTIGADAPYHLIPLLAAFERRYPAIQQTTTFGNSQRLLRILSDGTADVVILPEVEPDDRLHTVPFRRDQLVVFVNLAHPWSDRRSIRLAEMADQTVIQREPGSTTRAIFEKAIEGAEIRPAQIREFGSREAVREAVAAGLGIGVVNAGEFGHDQRLHQLTVRDASLDCLEQVICLRQRKDTPVLRAFLDIVADMADG